MWKTSRGVNSFWRRCTSWFAPVQHSTCEEKGVSSIMQQAIAASPFWMWDEFGERYHTAVLFFLMWTMLCTYCHARCHRGNTWLSSPVSQGIIHSPLPQLPNIKQLPLVVFWASCTLRCLRAYSSIRLFEWFHMNTWKMNRICSFEMFPTMDNVSNLMLDLLVNACYYLFENTGNIHAVVGGCLTVWVQQGGYAAYRYAQPTTAAAYSDRWVHSTCCIK